MKINKLIILIFAILTLISIIAILTIHENSDWKNIFIGLVASFFAILLIEIVNAIYDWKKISKLKGTYERIKITNISGQKQPDGGIYNDLTEEYNANAVNSKIDLKYKGEGEYFGTAFYEKGEVEFTINLNKLNPQIGAGTYQYSNRVEPDLGIYDIQIDKNNTNRIYVKYLNVIPSGNASGYEIWERETV